MKLMQKLSITTLVGMSTLLPAHAFDLQQAVQAARQYDAAYAAAKATQRAGAEKAVQGRSLLLPSIGLSAGYTNTNPIKPDADSYNNSNVGIQLSQPLFDLSAYQGYKKGQLAAELADLQLAADQQQLISDVAKAYFDVLLAQDVLGVTRATKAAYERQLAQARKAFEIGTATITDTHEAQAGFDAATAREISALSDLEIKQQILGQKTGLKPEEIRQLAGKSAFDAANLSDLATWQSRGSQQSLAIKAKTLQKELAARNLDDARGKHLPTVSLTAGYSANHTNEASSVARGARDTRGSSLGINLKMPLYAGGAINSQVSEAVANLEVATEQLEQTRRDTSQQIRRAWLGVSNGAALVKAQQQLLLSAKSKLDATKLGREVGVRTNLDQLNAEKDYQDAVRALAEARYSFLQAKLGLAQASGTLNDEVLAEVNGYLSR